MMIIESSWNILARIWEQNFNVPHINASLISFDILYFKIKIMFFNIPKANKNRNFIAILLIDLYDQSIIFKFPRVNIASKRLNHFYLCCNVSNRRALRQNQMKTFNLLSRYKPASSLYGCAVVLVVDPWTNALCLCVTSIGALRQCASYCIFISEWLIIYNVSDMSAYLPVRAIIVRYRKWIDTALREAGP